MIWWKYEKKIFVTDLDGTLLNTSHTVSDYSKQAIKKITDEGHVFCIATGRSWSESKEIYESIGTDAVVINSNGSHIHKPGCPDFDVTIEKVGSKMLNEIINDKHVASEMLAFFAVDIDNVQYLNVPEPLRKLLPYRVETEITVNPNDIKVINEPLSMIICVSEKYDEAKFAQEMKKFEDRIIWNSWSIPSSIGFVFIEINTKRTKADGLHALAKYYNSDPSEMYTFGDQRNDIQMTKLAGTGYAVKNAHPKLKEVADEILEFTNEEDAVVKKIMEITNISL